MPKNKRRNTRNKNKEYNITPKKEHNTTSILECEDKEINETPEKEFKRMIKRLLKNTEKQIHEMKKSTQYG